MIPAQFFHLWIPFCICLLAGMDKRHGTAYQEHLSALKQQAQDLERQLTCKRLEIADFINSAAPISFIPIEILAEIFKAGHRSARDASLFALIVSHVSHHWREVALHLPSLWTILHFGQGLLESEMLLNLYLERSRPWLLDVRFDHLSHPSHDDCHLIRPLALYRHTERWIRFTMNSTCPYITSFIFECLSSKMAPALESFETSYIGDWASGMGDPIFKGAGSAPRLSFMTLRNMGVTMATPSLASLACLQIGPDEAISDDTTYDWFGSELISKLENAPVLKSLVICHDLCARINEDNPIDILSLLSLEIRCTLSSQGQHISCLFSLIGASNLESLILDFPNHDGMSVFMDLLHEQPLSAKFPRLRMLSLHLHRIHDDLLVELCDLFPATTFILSVRESGHALLQLLDASHGDIHWHQLRSIFVPRPMYIEHLDLLCAVLTSRVAAGCPISRMQVEASFFRDVPRDRIRWLEERVELAM
jgi:hypothetical protein